MGQCKSCDITLHLNNVKDPIVSVSLFLHSCFFFFSRHILTSLHLLFPLSFSYTFLSLLYCSLSLLAAYKKYFVSFVMASWKFHHYDLATAYLLSRLTQITYIVSENEIAGFPWNVSLSSPYLSSVLFFFRYVGNSAWVMLHISQ